MDIEPITSITLPFADGRYRFWLPLAQADELERILARPDGNGTKLAESMCALEWSLREAVGLDAAGNAFYAGASVATARAVREVIRLALIGGNSAIIDAERSEVGPQRAIELVETYCYPARPLGEAAALAWRILAAAIYGNEPEGEVGAVQPIDKPEDLTDA